VSVATPSGWRNVELRDLITELDAGVSVNSEDRPIRVGEVGVLKTSCVTTGSFDATQHKAVLEKDVGRVATPVQRDRIIMSRMNTAALVGASAYVESDAPRLYLPDRLWQFTGRHGVSDARWLSYVLGCRKVRTVLSTLATGTSGSMKNLTKEQVRSLEVLLPPLNEQREIAAAIKAVDDAIAAGEAIVEQLDRTQRTLLVRLMERGVHEGAPVRLTPTGTAPSHWQQTTVSELASDISYGTSLPLNPDGAGVRVLRIPNVVSGDVDSDLKYAQLSERDLHSLRLFSDDLLVVRTNGNAAYVGKTLLFPKRSGDWAFASYLIRVRVDRERVLPAYLHYALQSPGVRRCVERGIRTSAGNYNLNTQGIRTTPLNLPPMDEQGAIVEALEAFAERARREHAALEQRRIVKAALADELLSGRLRVRNAA
jgi:type I restriction enzyme S subunit